MSTRVMAMAKHQVTLTTGVTVKLDGNVDALVEALYDEIVVKSGHRAGFTDMASEVSLAISQMDAADRDRYLFICLGTLIDRFHRELRRQLEGGIE
jgi:hypothetical protein